MSEDARQHITPILVAEDNLDDAHLLRSVFKRARILNPIFLVHDGAEAIEYLRGAGKYADRSAFPYPLLFLLDLKMPRKGGMDVLRWLSENPVQPSLPVVVIAGAGEMREVNCAYSLGARSFLVKPLTWLDVMELLSCFRELRMAAQGENYVLEPAERGQVKRLSEKPAICGYRPQPLDTKRLKLTDDVLRLTELLAENNHEVWARDRMAQGWTYGPKRDDEKKEHPCLVPYRDLPESEKLVDRNVALETIKTIFSFGLPYPILEKATDTVRAEVLAKTWEVLRQETLSPAELQNIWEEHNAVVWAQSVDLYRAAMEAALRFGEAFLALDVAAEGLKKYRDDVHLKQMQALALARTGAIDSATDVLEQLRSAGEPDEATLIMLAWTYKELWSIEAGAKRRHLKMSFELYSEAYKRGHDYKAGINAAVTGLLYGEREIACKIAREVEQMCASVLQQSGVTAGERYSVHTALAESSLVRGDLAAAEAQYQRAAQCATPNPRVLNQARAQARLLLERTGHSRHLLDGCFFLPRVVVCSGHMFDKPERHQMRFPFGMEIRVRDQMRRKLADLNAGIGFSSLACGTDMLFAETMLERGGEIHIVLPCSPTIFKASSVEIIPGARLGERFDEIVAKAASVTILDENCDGKDPAIYEYCNRIIMGAALLKSRLLGLDIAPLAVWDGRNGDGVGGTKNFVQLWQQRQMPVEVIDAGKMLDALAAEDTFLQQRRFAEKGLAMAQGGAESASTSSQIIQAVLFADIMGHTRLSQEQVPRFIQHFLMAVSALLDALPRPPIVRNTWGDTIHCVFDGVANAGCFALSLQEMTQKTDWAALGLPANLNVRITLHAGPVYPCVDPVSGKATFLGPHVNRATRIEPIAEEGQIYVTESFATLSESHGIKEYICEYVGQKQLPKRYGTIPVFILRRGPAH